LPENSAMGHRVVFVQRACLQSRASKAMAAACFCLLMSCAKTTTWLRGSLKLATLTRTGTRVTAAGVRLFLSVQAAVSRRRATPAVLGLSSAVGPKRDPSVRIPAYEDRRRWILGSRLRRKSQGCWHLPDVESSPRVLDARHSVASVQELAANVDISFRYRDSRGCEDTGGEVAFKQEGADKCGFIEQRQAKNRCRLMPMEIRILDKFCAADGIANNHGLAGALDGIKRIHRQQRFSDEVVTEPYDDCLLATRGLCRDPGFTSAPQQAAPPVSSIEARRSVPLKSSARSYLRIALKS
jgi:hypothetical protein